MLGHRGKPLFATHDVRDAHEAIVDDVGQVVRRVAIRLEQDEIVKLAVLHGNVSTKQIVELGGTLQRRGQANDGLDALRLIVGGLFSRQVATVPVIAHGRFGLALLFAQLGQPLGAAIAAVSAAIGHELFGVPKV